MLEDGRGRLSEPALETFVKEAIPRLPRLREHVHLQPGHSFLPFYVAHCVRKLHMLLEPKDKRGVPVDALLLSPDLAAFFALRYSPHPTPSRPSAPVRARLRPVRARLRPSAPSSLPRPLGLFLTQC